LSALSAAWMFFAVSASVAPTAIGVVFFLA
jgi:hypothetical protein